MVNVADLSRTEGIVHPEDRIEIRFFDSFQHVYHIFPAGDVCRSAVQSVGKLAQMDHASIQIEVSAAGPEFPESEFLREKGVDDGSVLFQQGDRCPVEIFRMIRIPEFRISPGCGKVFAEER